MKTLSPSPLPSPSKGEETWIARSAKVEARRPWIEDIGRFAGYPPAVNAIQGYTRRVTVMRTTDISKPRFSLCAFCSFAAYGANRSAPKSRGVWKFRSLKGVQEAQCGWEVLLPHLYRLPRHSWPSTFPRFPT